MGGLAGFYEEIREAVLNNGFDDPIFGWRTTSNADGYWFTPYSPKSQYKKSSGYAPAYRFSYTTNDIREKIATLKFLLQLCEAQESAIASFYALHNPRSKSFAYWLDFAATAVSEKKLMLTEHLLGIHDSSARNSSIPEIDIPVRSRILEYLVKHIIEDELKFQTADRTELINIAYDAIYYISDVEGVPFVRDERNSVWVNYLDSHFTLAIRNDHCCSRCGSDLYAGIPYCLSCNSVLSR